MLFNNCFIASIPSIISPANLLSHSGKERNTLAFSFNVDVASRIQGVQGPRVQGKAWMVFSLEPFNPRPSALAKGS
jgi:hypothetical protein